MSLYHGEPEVPAMLRGASVVPWGTAEEPPEQSGVYLILAVEAGALWPYWAVRFDNDWRSPMDYEMPVRVTVKYWIGPWSALKFDA